MTAQMALIAALICQKSSLQVKNTVTLGLLYPQEWKNKAKQAQNRAKQEKKSAKK